MGPFCKCRYKNKLTFTKNSSTLLQLMLLIISYYVIKIRILSIQWSTASLWNGRDALPVSVALAHTIKISEMLRRWLWITLTQETDMEVRTGKQVWHIVMEYILPPTESVVHDGYSMCQESEKYILISCSTCWDVLYAWRSKEGAGNVN